MLDGHQTPDRTGSAISNTILKDFGYLSKINQKHKLGKKKTRSVRAIFDKNFVITTRSYSVELIVRFSLTGFKMLLQLF